MALHCIGSSASFHYVGRDIDEQFTNAENLSVGNCALGVRFSFRND